MIKVFTTKNYFVGLLFLIFGIALIMAFLFLGLILLPIVLVILVVLYLFFGIKYLFRKKKRNQRLL